MSLWDGQQDEQEHFQRYSGFPQEISREGEPTAWKRFKEWILPWMRRKRELGDNYLEAEVLIKQAEVLDKLADVDIKRQQARKIAAETAEITARMEAEKAKEVTVVVNPTNESIQANEELITMMEEIEAKLEMLRTVYGGRLLLMEPEPVKPEDEEV